MQQLQANNQPIRLKDLETYLSDPITVALLDLIREHRDACKEVITETVLQIDSLKNVDLYKLERYRGQLDTLEHLVDLKDFLLEKVEIQDVKKT